MHLDIWWSVSWSSPSPIWTTHLYANKILDLFVICSSAQSWPFTVVGSKWFLINFNESQSKVKERWNRVDRYFFFLLKQICFFHPIWRNFHLSNFLVFFLLSLPLLGRLFDEPFQRVDGEIVRTKADYSLVNFLLNTLFYWRNGNRMFI